MFAQFKTLPELFDFFKDEETCIAYWEGIRWGETGITCPHCGGGNPYKTNRGYKCTNLECQKKFSAIVGSIFESTKIPMRLWFGAFYLATAHKKGISSLQLGRDLGIPQKTAWFLLHRIRETFKEEEPEVMKGIVEIDESYVGGKNKNRHADKKIKGSQGRSAKDKKPVVGFMERDGKVRTFVVDSTEASVLQHLIVQNVDKSATLVTDSYTSYKGSDKLCEKHVVVKHEGGGFYVVKEGETKFHTNNIEGFWTSLKRGYIGIYHYMSPKHLQRYCEEFSYRYNTRKETCPQRFEDTVKRCSGIRLTYANLIK